MGQGGICCRVVDQRRRKKGKCKYFQIPKYHLSYSLHNLMKVVMCIPLLDSNQYANIGPRTLKGLTSKILIC